MLLTESTFLFIFLPALIVLHVAVAGATTRDWLRDVVPLKALNALLLAGSVVYFVLLDPVLAVILVAATLFTYGVGVAIDRASRRRALLAFGLAGVALLMLGARYANALAENVGVFVVAAQRPAVTVSGPGGGGVVVLRPAGSGLSRRGVPAPRPARPESDPRRAVTPVLSVPAGRPDREAERDAGAVDPSNGDGRQFRLRHEAVLDRLVQEDRDRRYRGTDGRHHLRPACRLRSAPARAWLGLLCFALQIYFAVSAYSDMALGLGRMFGFRLSENFKWPYVARSVHEFWEKWFISLGQWLRDYLRLPLGSRSRWRDAARLCGDRRLAWQPLDVRRLGGVSRRLHGDRTVRAGESTSLGADARPSRLRSARCDDRLGILQSRQPDGGAALT